jgi:hypothetical protein
MFSERVDDDQDVKFHQPSHRPAFLTVRHAVFDVIDCMHIIEDSRGQFEGDSMVAKVLPRFLIVPLESDISHLRSTS